MLVAGAKIRYFFPRTIRQLAKISPDTQILQITELK